MYPHNATSYCAASSLHKPWEFKRLLLLFRTSFFLRNLLLILLRPSVLFHYFHPKGQTALLVGWCGYDAIVFLLLLLLQCCCMIATYLCTWVEILYKRQKIIQGKQFDEQPRQSLRESVNLFEPKGNR